MWDWVQNLVDRMKALGMNLGDTSTLCQDLMNNMVWLPEDAASLHDLQVGLIWCSCKVHMFAY